MKFLYNKIKILINFLLWVLNLKIDKIENFVKTIQVSESINKTNHQTILVNFFLCRELLLSLLRCKIASWKLLKESITSLTISETFIQ